MMLVVVATSLLIVLELSSIECYGWENCGWDGDFMFQYSHLISNEILGVVGMRSSGLVVYKHQG